MKNLRWLLLCSMLAACIPGNEHCPMLPGGERYCLQKGGATAFATLQKTSIHYGQQQITLLTRIESDDKGLRFVGLSPFGQTLMSVSWENGVLRAQLPPALQGKLDPAALLALIQIAQWPEDQVRAGLGPQWEMTATSNRRRLQLTGQNNTMLDISWNGLPPYERLSIVAPGANFRMDATRLDEGDDKSESKP